MFNVSWSDPASETVAQRRERKERHERTSVRSSAASSLRSDESNDSSKIRNSNLDAKSTKVSASKQTITLKREKSLLKSIKPPIEKKNPHSNIRGTSPDSQQTIKGLNTIDCNEPGDRLRDSVTNTLHSAPLSNGRSNTTSSSWSSVAGSMTNSYEIQALAENSFVTRSTEVTTKLQDHINALNAPRSEVSVSAKAPYSDEFSIEIGSDTFRFPRVPGRTRLNGGETSTALARKNSRTVSPMARKGGDLWRPPTEWDYLPGNVNSLQLRDNPGIYLAQPLNDDAQAASLNGSTHLHRQIRRMNAANPKIMMERMQEEWNEVDDAVCQELDFEKHLWMLTGLKYLIKQTIKKSEKVGNKEEETSLTIKASSIPSKVLSLFESQASASFLAAFTTTAEIHHIATSPLPPCPIQHAPNKTLPSCSIPHVYPLTVPTASPQIPFAQLLFSSISALNLPAILPSSSIPPLLRECYRVLRPAGTLHLTILDPLPVLTTTGPLMRAWLEKHVILSLEKHFRCMSPQRLIPMWLKEAKFSYQATVLKFWTVAKKGEGGLELLNTVVGKMLWKEMWGRYLDGKDWWWDDEALVEECGRMETRWECSLIEAVRT